MKGPNATTEIGLQIELMDQPMAHRDAWFSPGHKANGGRVDVRREVYYTFLPFPCFY